MTDSSVSELVARAQRGSAAAAGALYAHFQPKIYRYLYFRTGDPQTAEDLTGEVFLKMVRFLPDYHPKEVPFQAWLFRIASNLAIDHHRRTSTHPEVEVDEELDARSEPMDDTIQLRLSCEALQQALAGLNEAQRDVVVLRFIEGLAITETAAILHRSEDSVKALQRRGLQALRLKLTTLQN